MTEPLDLDALESMLRHGHLLDGQGVIAELISELRSERKQHECTKSFHHLAVQERDYERVRFDRVEAQRNALQSSLLSTQKLLNAALGAK